MKKFNSFVSIAAVVLLPVMAIVSWYVMTVDHRAAEQYRKAYAANPATVGACPFEQNSHNAYKALCPGTYEFSYSTVTVGSNHQIVSIYAK